MTHREAYAALDDVLCRTIADFCRKPVAEVTAETHVVDLNIDSLTFVSILAATEAVYEVQFSPDDVTSLFEAVTVGDLARALHGLVEAAPR